MALLDPQNLAALVTLTVLEIVLGIDNLVFIAVSAARLPKARQAAARRVGLALALFTRLALLAAIAWMAQLTVPIFELLGQSVSWRDLVLFAGGLFLLYKGTFEIHESVEDVTALGDRDAIKQILLVLLDVTEFVRLSPGMTVAECLKHIRSVAREKESIFSCYVLEPDTGRLLGSVSLRDLVMAEMDQPVERVMRRKPATVQALDDQELVANRIAKYNLLAVPVVEKDGSVVGFVTVDDVIDVMIEEGTEDVLKMAAIEPGALDKPYFQNPILTVVRKRVGWLLLLFVAGTLTGTVLRRYEGELAAVVALAFFIPLLIGTGGNAGAQTVMTIIRSLAIGEIRFKDVRKVALREAATGLIVGVLVGLAAFGQAKLTGANTLLAVTVAATMLAICIWSTAVGALVPMFAQRFGIDPAALSAPLITTLVDATGLVIYFQIAKVFLGL